MLHLLPKSLAVIHLIVSELIAAPALLTLSFLFPCVTQLKSELADLQTSGSVFLSDVTTLVGEARYEEYFLRMVPHIDLVYKQCSDKGESSPKSQTCNPPGFL